MESLNMDMILQIQTTLLARHNFEFWHPKLALCEAKSHLKDLMYPPTIDDRKANIHAKIPFTSLAQVLPMEPAITDPSYSFFLLIFLPMSSWQFLQRPWVSLGFPHFPLLCHIPLIIFLIAFRLLASSSASALSVSTCLIRHIDLRTCMSSSRAVPFIVISLTNVVNTINIHHLYSNPIAKYVTIDASKEQKQNVMQHDLR